MARKSLSTWANRGSKPVPTPEPKTLPSGVVWAGGARISVPLQKSPEAKDAALTKHLQYLADAVNAPRSPHLDKWATKEDAEAKSRKANTMTEMVQGSKSPVPANKQLDYAQLHISAANELRAVGGASERVHEHVTRAKEHCEAAGSGLWDESKHPRDEQGKFT